jgi:hypothetical protein
MGSPGTSYSQAFAPTWRDEATGEIAGTAGSGTWCIDPIRPWHLVAVQGDYTHVLPCRKCHNCLEYYRRCFCDRLMLRYPDRSARLFLVRIDWPIELAAELSRKLHRRVGLELERGFIRIGAESFGLLVREPAPLRALLSALKIKFSCWRVQLKRKRRAWREVSAGLVVARAAYGSNLNRWYMPGLPKLPREPWEIQRHAMQKPWRKWTGARTRNGQRCILVPPELWRLSIPDRRRYRDQFHAATTPEAVSQLIDRMRSAIAANSRDLNYSKPAARPSDIADAREYRRRYLLAQAAGAPSNSGSGSSPPNLFRGSYTTSVHSGNAPPPGVDEETWLLELGPSGKPRWIERQIRDREAQREAEAAKVQRNIQDVQERFEKLRLKAKERESKDGNNT